MHSCMCLYRFWLFLNRWRHIGHFLSRPLNDFPPSESACWVLKCSDSSSSDLEIVSHWSHAQRLGAHMSKCEVMSGRSSKLSSQFGHGHFFFCRICALINLNPSLSSKSISQGILVNENKACHKQEPLISEFWSCFCIQEYWFFTIFERNLSTFWRGDALVSITWRKKFTVVVW